MDNDASDYLGQDDSHNTPLLERGSFEDARARLDTMVDEMATAITAAFPDCPMTPDGKGDRVTGGGSTDEWVDGVWAYEINSENRGAPCSVSDTRERADMAVELITTIAERYDFQPHITYNDHIAPNGEGYVAFEGWNADGDRYTFGSAAYTNLRYDSAPRFTAEQLDAIEAGETPPQPSIDELEAPTSTTLETSSPSPTLEAFPDDTTRDRRHGHA